MLGSDEAVRHGPEFRRCLIELDVDGMIALWRHVAKSMPQPKTRKEVLYTLHMARTVADSVPLKLRQYSHDWLKERGIMSPLPRDLWP